MDRRTRVREPGEAGWWLTWRSVAAAAAGLVVSAVVVYAIVRSDEASSPVLSTEPGPSVTNTTTIATGPPPPPNVAAGPLVATVRDGDWRLDVADRAGDSVLASVARGGIVVTTADGRARSTTVRSIRVEPFSIAATVDTDTATRLRVHIRPVRDVLGVTIRAHGAGVRRVALDLVARRGERFFGLGQRATGVEHRGQTVENRVLDGPYTADQLDIVEGFVPEPGFSRRRDATYFPMPWVLSSRGYGVLVGNDATSRFELATRRAPDRWRIEVDGDRIDLRVVAGPSPAEALERMTRLIGRQPPAPAPFVFGPWWQASDDEEVVELAAMRRADVPLSMAQTYTHYLPCGDERGRRDDERARTRRLHDAGMAVTTYVNPMVCEGLAGVRERGVRSGAFTKAPDGSPYRYRYSTSTTFDVAQFDFSAAPGRRLFESVLADTVEDGFDGWMEDFGEYTPGDAASADGTAGAVMHNRYVEQYHAAANRFAARSERPLARFNRSGWTGAIEHSAVVWGGDPTSRWGFDGLSSAVASGLGMGLSGVSRWGSDIGGFFVWPDDQLTPELLSRWIQFGAMSGVMRLQAGGISLSSAPRATVGDPAVLPVWRRYARLRTQLYPYIAAADHEYRASGLPIMRHLVLVAPGDEQAVATIDQYLFGQDLLVAPVVEPGATSRTVYLPDGAWIDLWRSTRIDRKGDVRLAVAATKALRGGRDVRVEAPLAEIPIHVRAGAVIPMLSADVDTLAPYGDDEVVQLRDRGGRRRLLAFPGADWNGPLGIGESMTSRVDGDRWTLTVRAARPRTYELEAAIGGFADRGGPCVVSVDGEAAPSLLDGAGDVLRADLALDREATVVVRCD